MLKKMAQEEKERLCVQTTVPFPFSPLSLSSEPKAESIGTIYTYPEVKKNT
jgi:hypothetical protein